MPATPKGSACTLLGPIQLGLPDDADDPAHDRDADQVAGADVEQPGGKAQLGPLHTTMMLARWRSGCRIKGR